MGCLVGIFSANALVEVKISLTSAEVCLPTPEARIWMLQMEDVILVQVYHLVESSLSHHLFHGEMIIFAIFDYLNLSGGNVPI